MLEELVELVVQGSGVEGEKPERDHLRPSPSVLALSSPRPDSPAMAGSVRVSVRSLKC